MLLATTIMLLVFRSPSAIISVMWLISAKMFVNDKPPFPLRKFHSIANLCATLNAATTFIMFIIYGTKFRSEFTYIYCGILYRIKKSKKTTIIKQEQQQMKQLISNNKNENKQHINDIKPKMNLSLKNKSNRKHYLGVLKNNNSTVTSTTTSSGSFSVKKKRQDRDSYDEEYDLIMNHNKNIHISPRQLEVTIREDECIENHNDTKSTSLTESYFNWFTNFIRCRQ
jgi:hypothetical protein